MNVAAAETLVPSRMEKTVAEIPGEPRVAVVMAVLNGETYLPEQLNSIERQTVGHIDLWVSDDGSRDRTLRILHARAEKWSKGKFRVANGPRAGFAENFRSLLTNESIDADYVAFSDQAALWDPDKLAAAIAWLSTIDPARPALYCSRTRIVSSNGEYLGLSPLFSKTPSFRNALVQSIAGGNTMVMNRAARKLVLEASKRAPFVSHDWWCYLIVSGAGGVVHYAYEPRIRYRMHHQNVVGANNTWRARMRRLTFMAKGKFGVWNTQNLSSLRQCSDMLTPEARACCKLFERARSGSTPARFAALVRARLYRQTLAGQIGLFAACFLNKL